jgi:hypothetical protein
MDLSEAIRVAEKIRPWVNRNNELRAGLDALIDLAREQQGKAKRKSPLTELWEEMFGPVPTEDEMPEPAPTERGTSHAVAVLRAMAARLGVEYDSDSAVSTAALHAELHKRLDAAGVPRQSASEPEPIKVGDTVPWPDLDRVPVGTVVAWVTGERGVVREDGGAHDVAWSDAKLRGGGTVKIVLLPEEATL